LPLQTRAIAVSKSTSAISPGKNLNGLKNHKTPAHSTPYRPIPVADLLQVLTKQHCPETEQGNRCACAFGHWSRQTVHRFNAAPADKRLVLRIEQQRFDFQNAAHTDALSRRAVTKKPNPLQFRWDRPANAP
jgi:hypothetical protein